MEISIRSNIVIVRGEIDMSNADRVLEAMSLVDDEVLLDLTGVTFIDSSGILAILSDGPFVLVSVSSQVRRIMEILGLGHLLPQVHGDL